MDAWIPPAGGRVRAAIDTMMDADGLVFDLRGNPGGVGQIAQSVAGLLFADPVSLGAFKARDGEIPLRTGTPRQRENDPFVPYMGPLAILTDGGSGSTSEVFTAGLLDAGRARVFGEPTAGAALPARITPLPNGDSLMHAVFDYIRPIGRSVEGRPIVPDEVVFLRRSDLLAGRDRVLESALTWIAGATARPEKEVVLDD
jgi:carboxyl-terminal processing protease